MTLASCKLLPGLFLALNMQVTVYTKPGCHLCEDVLTLLDRLTPQYNLQVDEVNILDDMALYDRLHNDIPVVMAQDGRYGRLVSPIMEPELRAYLEVVRREERPSASVLPAYKESAIDRAARWVGRHWLRLALIAVAIFVGLPWLAPVFAALGWWDIANPIYTAYALTCHQLPERAGNIFGYQVAFCYRNTAIYSGMLLFGSLYALARDRNIAALQWLRRPLRWWLFVPMLLPMALDGFSHMFGLRDTMLDMSMNATFNDFMMGSQVLSLNWWLRVITGGLAAFGAVWFAFPRMDSTIQESEAQMEIYRQSRREYRAPGVELNVQGSK